jgi:hypothetical protein
MLKNDLKNMGKNVPSTVKVGSFFFLHKPRVNQTQSEVVVVLHIKTIDIQYMTPYSLVDVGTLKVNWYLPEFRTTRFEHSGSIYL